MPALIVRNADARDVLKKVRRSFGEYRRDVEYLAEHKAELTDSYPDEWVAVYEEAIVAHSKRTKDLMRQLKAKGVADRSPVIQFLSTSPHTLIL